MTATHRYTIRRAAVACVMLLLSAGPLFAQASPFGVAAPEPAIAPQEGLFAEIFGWIAVQQSAIYRTLSGLVQAFRTDPMAGLMLVGISFVYGVLHAAGPGHGKAVITSYLVATGEGVRRGIVLSFAAAFVQALSAIILVGLFSVVLRATSMAMTQATHVVEIASYALVTAIGAWLIYAKTASLLRAAPAVAHAHGHAGGHHHHHGEYCSSCGHSHGPDPNDLSGPWSARRAAAAVLAVGIRPCTGAVLVLVFAFSQGVLGIGIASAFAMAAGTGLTVAMIAALAVGARGLAARLAAGGNGWAMGALRAVELGAALLILLFGLALLGGALAMR
jgi:nickel/cobalt transporter (NicO) family protein